jgi:hypothetical protein
LGISLFNIPDRHGRAWPGDPRKNVDPRDTPGDDAEGS